jgi:hyperosmotically inducible periplasmic protein
MKIRHFTMLATLFLAPLAGCEPRPADQDGVLEREPGASERATEPDNTARNAEDRRTDAKTPFDQAENGADIATTAAIRREILKAEGLSTNADNIKIITSNGQVTLRGVVENESEREQVRAIAQRIAGSADKVDMQLEIDPDGEKVEDREGDAREDDVEGAREPVQDPTRR